MKHSVYIGLGSNTSDRIERINHAFDWLSSWLDDIRFSSIYPTEPEGDDAWNEYVNAVACGKTDLTVEKITAILKCYETANGRTAELKKKDIITIDLDLVIDGDTVIRDRDLKRYYFLKGYNELTGKR